MFLVYIFSAATPNGSKNNDSAFAQKFIDIHISVKKLAIVLAIFVFCSFSQESIGQNGYSSTHFTDNIGFPENTNRSMTTDPGGFIWLTTENNLTRFGGRHVVILDRRRVDTNSNHFYWIQFPLNIVASAKAKGQKPRADPKTSKLADFYQLIRSESNRAPKRSIYLKNIVNLPPLSNNGAHQTFLTVGLPSYLKYIEMPMRYIIPSSYGSDDFHLADSNKVGFYEGGKIISI